MHRAKEEEMRENILKLELGYQTYDLTRLVDLFWMVIGLRSPWQRARSSFSGSFTKPHFGNLPSE